MKLFLRIAIALTCFFGFALVRFRESELFYDPLIQFFHGDYQHSGLPELEKGRLLFNLFLRYALHMVLSLLILWVAFKEKGILKFASVFYTAVFILLMSVFIVLMSGYEAGAYSALFYTRRFLIQPLLIFILLPAFYYYRKVNN